MQKIAIQPKITDKHTARQNHRRIIAFIFDHISILYCRCIAIVFRSTFGFHCVFYSSAFTASCVVVIFLFSFRTLKLYMWNWSFCCCWCFTIVQWQKPFKFVPGTSNKSIVQYVAKSHCTNTNILSLPLLISISRSLSHSLSNINT